MLLLFSFHIGYLMMCTNAGRCLTEQEWRKYHNLNHNVNGLALLILCFNIFLFTVTTLSLYKVMTCTTLLILQRYFLWFCAPQNLGVQLLKIEIHLWKANEWYGYGTLVLYFIKYTTHWKTLQINNASNNMIQCVLIIDNVYRLNTPAMC
jgi:hypothetical protein